MRGNSNERAFFCGNELNATTFQNCLYHVHRFSFEISFLPDIKFLSHYLRLSCCMTTKSNQYVQKLDESLTVSSDRIWCTKQVWRKRPDYLLDCKVILNTRIGVLLTIVSEFQILSSCHIDIVTWLLKKLQPIFRWHIFLWSLQYLSSLASPDFDGVVIILGNMRGKLSYSLRYCINLFSSGLLSLLADYEAMQVSLGASKRESLYKPLKT